MKKKRTCVSFKRDFSKTILWVFNSKFLVSLNHIKAENYFKLLCLCENDNVRSVIVCVKLGFAWLNRVTDRRCKPQLKMRWDDFKQLDLEEIQVIIAANRHAQLKNSVLHRKKQLVLIICFKGGVRAYFQGMSFFSHYKNRQLF